jgi:hypothetical protein
MEVINNLLDEVSRMKAEEKQKEAASRFTEMEKQTGSDGICREPVMTKYSNIGNVRTTEYDDGTFHTEIGLPVLGSASSEKEKSNSFVHSIQFKTGVLMSSAIIGNFVVYELFSKLGLGLSGTLTAVIGAAWMFYLVDKNK